MVRALAQDRIAQLVAAAFMMAVLAAYTVSVAKADTRGDAAETFVQDLGGRRGGAPGRRTMSEDQRAEFQELFAEWLLTSYAGRLGGYDGQTLEIVNSLELQNKARDILVRTRVIHADGQPPVAAELRIRDFGGELKIIDVIVEAVSMRRSSRRARGTSRGCWTTFVPGWRYWLPGTTECRTARSSQPVAGRPALRPVSG